MTKFTALGVVGVAALVAAMPGAVASPTSSAEPTVPIVDQRRVPDVNRGGEAVVSLHAVRRVEGGTAIYYSIGGVATNTTSIYVPGIDGDPRAIFKGKKAGIARFNAVIASQTKQLFTGLAEGGNGDCVCSDFIDRVPGEPGKAYVLYQVVAPLPDTVDVVDVHAGGQYFAGVTVEDGALEPALDPSKPILVGTGWPRIDAAAIQADTSPQTSVHDLRFTVSDAEKTIVRRDDKAKIAVSLAADVLFAVDKADLSPQARSVIQRAAAEMQAAGASGAVQVVGHTDSNGSDAPNLDLSKRRAAAVAGVLTPLLGSGVTIQTSGMGEKEPVADNATDEGRQLNRRVTVSFQAKGKN